MKPVIICLTGESGTGKTTIAEYIEEKYNIPSIYSYTDRPPRYPNERGHTFVTPQEYDEFDISDMIAYTNFGGNRYCCLKQDVKPFNTYVIDEHGLKYLERNFGEEYEIFKVRITRDESLRDVDKARIERDRGMFGNDIKYDLHIANESSIENLHNNIKIVMTYIMTRIYQERL